MAFSISTSVRSTSEDVYFIYEVFIEVFSILCDVSCDKIILFVILDVICIIDSQFCKMFVHGQNKSGLMPKFPKLYKTCLWGKALKTPVVKTLVSSDFVKHYWSK